MDMRYAKFKILLKQFHFRVQQDIRNYATKFQEMLQMLQKYCFLSKSPADFLCVLTSSVSCVPPLSLRA